MAAAALAGWSAGAGAACGTTFGVALWSADPDALGRNAGGGSSIVFFGSIGTMNGSAMRGRFGVTPLEPRGRITGVIMTTSSV